MLRVPFRILNKSLYTKHLQWSTLNITQKLNYAYQCNPKTQPKMTPYTKMIGDRLLKGDRSALSKAITLGKIEI